MSATTEIGIDFLLGKDLSSRLIGWYGCGYGGFSHAAPRLMNGDYIDARNNWTKTVDGKTIPAGVQRRPEAVESWTKCVRATLPVSLAEYKAWEKYLRAGINQRYDQADILGFILGKPLTQGDGYWICSEWGASSLQAINRLPKEFPFPLRECTPNSLLWMVATAGFTLTNIIGVKQ